MSDNLDGLSLAIRGYFNTLANLDTYLGNADATIFGTYRLEFRLAGIDTDGKAKIGSLDLLVQRQHWPDGQTQWASVEKTHLVEAVPDTLLIRTAGIDAIANDMINHADHYSAATVMRDYVEARKKDDGASLTTEFMTKLGHLFKLQTMYGGVREVGGLDQVAVIVKGDQIRLGGLENFPAIKNPIRFVTWLCEAHAGISGTGSIVPIGPRSPVVMIWQGCTFNRFRVDIDGQFFFNCTFLDSPIEYNGGDSLFGDDNHIEGSSSLHFGDSRCRRPDIVQQLERKFGADHKDMSDPNGTYSPPVSACPPRPDPQ